MEKKVLQFIANEIPIDEWFPNGSKRIFKAKIDKYLVILEAAGSNWDGKEDHLDHLSLTVYHYEYPAIPLFMEAVYAYCSLDEFTILKDLFYRIVDNQLDQNQWKNLKREFLARVGETK